jgi:hypothetical protein
MEVEGGLFSKNPRAKMAHNMPTAILRDMEKGNAAVILGWRVLRYTPGQVSSGAFLTDVLTVLDGARPDPTTALPAAAIPTRKKSGGSTSSSPRSWLALWKMRGGR